MGPYTLLSWNVKGANMPERRSMIFNYRQRSQICFLQEIHFRKDALSKFRDHRYQFCYNNVYPISKTRGVSILFYASLPWEYIDEWSDVEGRILLMKGRIGRQIRTVVNVYAPNPSWK